MRRTDHESPNALISFKCAPAPFGLTLDVAVLYVSDVAVHETRGEDGAHVAGKRRQIRVTGVVKYVVFHRNNRKTREGHIHF